MDQRNIEGHNAEKNEGTERSLVAIGSEHRTGLDIDISALRALVGTEHDLANVTSREN